MCAGTHPHTLASFFAQPSTAHVPIGTRHLGNLSPFTTTSRSAPCALVYYPFTMSQPFRAIYEKSGARFVEVGGESLPDTVVGLDIEYEAAMSSAVTFERFQQSQIEVTGADRESFLQNMLTNDIRTLPVGLGVPAAFLTNKGKLISDLLVSKEIDSIRLRMETSRAEVLRSSLDRYIISEDVVLSSLDEKEQLFSVAGPQAAEILAVLLGRERAELVELPHLGILRAGPAESPIRLIGFGREPTPRFDVMAPTDRATELFVKAVEASAVLAGRALSETRRLEASVARFGVDMDETNLPLEAGLEEAVSFDKGCYIGQEYVVRLAHRGHLNRKLVGLRLSGNRVPSFGATVLSGSDEAGHVTTAANSPYFGAVLALGYLKRAYFEPGTEVQIEGTRALVSSLPFRTID